MPYAGPKIFYSLCGLPYFFVDQLPLLDVLVKYPRIKVTAFWHPGSFCTSYGLWLSSLTTCWSSVNRQVTGLDTAVVYSLYKL